MKWQPVFDSTLYGALKLFLISRKQTTVPYLSSIKEIYVTFLQNSTHFHFSIFSVYYSFLYFLPFSQLFYLPLLSTFYFLATLRTTLFYSFLSSFTVFFIFLSATCGASILSIFVRNIISSVKLNNWKILQNETCCEYSLLSYFPWFPPSC